jgi:hypothetical protein
VTQIALKVLRSRWAGWIVAAGVVLWFSMNPNVKTVERVEWKTRTEVQTRVVTKTKVVTAPDSRTEVRPDGTTVITGTVTLDTTRSETGTERTTTEGTHTKVTTPSAWKARVGASVLIPPPLKLSEMRKQVEADVRIGKILIFDVGAGVRVVFPPASYSPEFWGVGVSLTF